MIYHSHAKKMCFDLLEPARSCKQLPNICCANKERFAPHHSHEKNSPSTWVDGLFFWCGRQDLNLHGDPPDPKSGASASSATPAYYVIVAQKKLKVNIFINNSKKLFKNLLIFLEDYDIILQEKCDCM